MENIILNKFVLLNMAAGLQCDGCPLLHECEMENNDTLAERNEYEKFPSCEVCLNLWLKSSNGVKP